MQDLLLWNEIFLTCILKFFFFNFSADYKLAMELQEQEYKHENQPQCQPQPVHNSQQPSGTNGGSSRLIVGPQVNACK